MNMLKCKIMELEMKPLRVIIPAAGKGSRLKKISGDLPKSMFSVANKPILEHILENTSFIDKKDTYIVVGFGKEKIIDYFGDNYIYVEQKQPLGTGHAIMECAKEFEGFDGSVLITFGDMPLFRREEMEVMCRQHAENDADCTLMTAANASLKLWARIIRDEDGRFARIVEGKDCTPEQAAIKELFSGVMVFNSKSLFQVLPEIGCSNIQKEYYITEVPELMVKKGMKVETYFTEDGDDLRGINTPEDLEICESILNNRSIQRNNEIVRIK